MEIALVLSGFFSSTSYSNREEYCFLKSLLKILIILTGIYCIAHIIFDLTFNPTLNIATNVIQALFFLFVLCYITFFRKETK
jgi:hypothetical protein